VIPLEFNRLMQRPLIVFDVNETLLDLTSMESFFDRVFGDRLLLRLWFANFVLYSEALSLANCYVAFGDIAAATLRMLQVHAG
jgi:2-haloacid dehalogenase